MPISTGPAIRGVCRVVKRNACGSGTIVGHMNGKTLVLTNHHVAGGDPRADVSVEVESLGMRKFTGHVIRSAYSTSVSADWAIVQLNTELDVAPVYLTKKLPPSGYSLYTKGFPRCQPFGGSDITQQRTLNNGVLLWLPDAIGGQSGSGVFGDDDHLVYALLTWSMTYGRKSYGAGQLTNEIYRQNRLYEMGYSLSGYPRMPGLEELPGNYDYTGVDRDGLDDVVLIEGFSGSDEMAGVQDLPIWAEDQEPEPPPTDPGEPDQWRNRGIEYLRKRIESDTAELAAWENAIAQPIDPPKPGDVDSTFGL